LQHDEIFRIKNYASIREIYFDFLLSDRYKSLVFVCILYAYSRIKISLADFFLDRTAYFLSCKLDIVENEE